MQNGIRQVLDVEHKYSTAFITPTSNDMDEALRRVQGRPAPTTKPRTTAVA
ncbi:hypothetical protein OG473_39925 (plasmid) [Streptomyces anulatus]|uniref:hypothetical protein n=1 Tax=Streptomyces anulatus TaxID=1892 RepID=UPI0032506016